MKKLLLLMFVTVLTATKSFAGYGWYDGSMNIGGVTTDFTAWSTSSDSPTDLGILTDMTITSIAFNVWSDANDRGGANMYFRIWDGKEQKGEDQDLWLGGATRISGDHDFSISWTGTEDLAELVELDLEPGKTYYIDIYAKTYGTSGDEWYNGGGIGVNYHAKLTYYPFTTYTRTVTSGNYGTICLPFNATVTGADIFTISSKVMGSNNKVKYINFTPVEGNTLEAGKAYIFKATSSTLTASLSGNYSDAIAANGMMGNISSTSAIDVSSGNLIIKNNMLYEVGTGVTCGQYKGYITPSTIDVASARGANFMGFEDETTGIDTIDNGQFTIDNDAPMYNLAGQKVTKSYKGVVIVNGKKVVLK